MPSWKVKKAFGLPTSQKVPDRSVLILIERKFVHHITRQTVWPIVARSRAVGIAVVRILGSRNFTLRLGVEDLRRRVDESAPGVVDARTEILTQALVETDLHRVINRLGTVAP